MTPVPDNHFWIVCTVYMEAGSEPDLGMEAVARVIRNRTTDQRTFCKTIFAPYQFSCWNTDEASLRYTLGDVEKDTWRRCDEAVSRAFDPQLPDPSGGANSYLNVELTRRINGGRLPKWYDPNKITAVIGRHTFLKI